MATSTPGMPYVLGRADSELTRLMRQAAIFAPFTERLFRDAGIGPGQHVLDIGSGVGDVAMLVAGVVGPTGEVLGVERDASTIARARSRVLDAGLRNVRFVEADVGHVVSSDPFDAIVGRLILEFLPEPAAVLRSLSPLVRPGGVVVIQDACWGPLLQLTAPLPLRARCAALIHQTFERSGANMDMELVLYRAFQEAGFPSPDMRIDVPLGGGPEIARWVPDLLWSLLPQMHEDVAHEFGDLDSLRARLDAELAATRTFAACIGLVGAWSRKTALP